MKPAVGTVSSVMLVLVLAASGCARTETNGKTEPSTGEDVGGSAGTGGGDPVELPPDSTCVAGTSCMCESGEIGETHCGDGIGCDCTACPPYSPPAPPPFKACGGSVEGTWRTRSYDLSGLVTYFGLSAIEDTEPVACRTDFSELAAPDLRLALTVNGSAEVDYRAPDLYGTVLEACIQSGLGRSCDQVPNCRRTGCGTCGCGLVKSDFSGDAVSWSETSTTLTVGPLSFDYCVTDQILALRNRDNGIRFELERVVAPEQKCVGSPNECGLNETEKDCHAVRGCSLAASCTGDAVRTCDYPVDACTLCPVGCECRYDVGQSQCAGTAHCEDMKTEFDCQGLGCDWRGFVGCGGIPTPCDSLTVAECRFTPGCHVE